MNQIALLQASVSKTLEVVKKECQRSGRSSSWSDLDSRIFAVEEEVLHINSMPVPVHRVYVQGPDFPAYSNVGWLLTNDVDHCLICASAFGMFLYKNYCWACGNIVCAYCCPNEVEIHEIRTLGLKRVCVQCYWGQDKVFAAPNYRGPPVAKSQSITAAEIASPLTTAAQAAEIAAAKQRSEQEEKFRLDALSRLKSKAAIPDSPTAAGAASGGGVPFARSVSTSSSDDARHSQHTGTAGTAQVQVPVLASATGRDVFYTTGPAAGFMVSVPTPGLVLKTKRNDDMTKVFINVCSHSSIPDKASKDSVWLVVGEFRGSFDKDGSSCAVVDVMLQPSDVALCASDETARVKICSQALLTVQAVYCVPLDSAYKVLRLASNYKGDSSTVASSFLPSKDKFQGDGVKVAQEAADLYQRLSPSQAISLYLDSGRSSSNKGVLQRSNSSIGGPDGDPSSSSSSSSRGGKSGTTASRTTDLLGITKPSAAPANAVISIDPVPGFVMKTFDAEQTKVFVNVSHHDSVPSYPPSSALALLAIGRPPFFAICPDRDFFDKEGGKTIIIVVVVSSDIYDGLDKELGMEAPLITRFCGQLMKAMNETRPRQKQLETENITFPKTKNGFKGEADTLKAVSVHIPSLAAFARTNSELEGGMGGSGVRDSVSGSKIAVALLPHSALTEASSSTVASSVVDLSAVLLQPEPGFVVEAVKENGQRVFLNICHHESVGVNELEGGGRGGGEGVEGGGDDIKCIVGSLGIFTSDSSAKKCLTLDVTISTADFIRCLEDATGEQREQLTISVLEFVGRFGVPLSGDYALPNIPGGYKKPTAVVGYCNASKSSSSSSSSKGGGSSRGSISKAPSKAAEPTFPLQAFNILTNQNRLQQTVPVFTGELFKLGHSVKSWKKRKMQLAGRRIKYFEKGSLKGEFDIKDCRINVPATADTGAPSPYQFSLESTATSDQALVCCAASEEEREQWIQVITTQSCLIAASAACLNCPHTRTGYLKKQGHFIRNWQTRYIVLEMGLLRYYEKESVTGGKGTGDGLKGQLSLVGTTVSCQGNDKIYISAGLEGSKDLLLLADSPSQCKLWVADLEKHAAFADENQYLVDI